MESVKLEDLNYGKIREMVDGVQKSYLMGVIVDQNSNVLNGVLMDYEAVAASLRSQRVIASARTRDGWRAKGSIVTGFSQLSRVFVDCDHDTLLLQVSQPVISTCINHAGSSSCFNNGVDRINFDLPGELAISIVQSAIDKKVLMVGMMSREALAKTIETGKVTFWARSKKRLWTKGERSGNHLALVDMKANCWGSAILCSVKPPRNVCHLGTETCFTDPTDKTMLRELNWE